MPLAKPRSWRICSTARNEAAAPSARAYAAFSRFSAALSRATALSRSSRSCASLPRCACRSMSSCGVSPTAGSHESNQLRDASASSPVVRAAAASLSRGVGRLSRSNLGVTGSHREQLLSRLLRCGDEPRAGEEARLTTCHGRPGGGRDREGEAPHGACRGALPSIDSPAR